LKSKHENYLTFGRGFAIILVISTHFLQNFEINNLYFLYIIRIFPFGVQLFFVISAISLIISSDNRKEKNYKFYLRRFFRIAPMYYLAIFFYNYNNTNINITHILSNIFFLHGFYTPANNSVVPGGWSIATEMTFYLIFPFLLTYCNNKSLIRLLITLFIFTLTYWIFEKFIWLRGLGIIIGPILGNTFSQFVVFFLTILLFSKKKFFFNNKINIIILIILLIINIISINNITNFKILNFHITKLIFLTLFCYVFLMFIKNLKIIKKNNFICKLGECSYSMYIFHFYTINEIIKFSKNLKIDSTILIENNLLLILLLLIIWITYLIAWITTNTIEKYGIKIGKKIIELNL